MLFGLCRALREFRQADLIERASACLKGKNMLLFTRQTHDVTVQIRDLLEQILVPDEGAAEAYIFPHKQNNEEHDPRPEGVGQNDCQDRQDPVKHAEAGGIAL